MGKGRRVLPGDEKDRTLTVAQDGLQEDGQLYWLMSCCEKERRYRSAASGW